MDSSHIHFRDGDNEPKILKELISKDDVVMCKELLIHLGRNQYIARYTQSFELKCLCPSDTLELLHDIFKRRLHSQENISVKFGLTWWIYFSHPGKISLPHTINNDTIFIFLTSAHLKNDSKEYFLNAGDVIMCKIKTILRSIQPDVEVLECALC